jgi:hypothetical protein
MDSSADPQAFDDKKSEAANASAADAASEGREGGSRALTPFEAKASGSGGGEAQKPEPLKAAPIPSSALVILPPKKEKFDGSFAAGERLGGTGRAKRTSWMGYALGAAVVLIVAGGVYAVGGHYLSLPGLPPLGEPVACASSGTAPCAVQQPAPAAAVAVTDPALIELRRDNQALGEQVRKLQARLAALQTAPEEIRGLKKNLDGLKASLDAEKAEAKSEIAQLTAKLDHAHVAAAEKARVGRLDAKAIQATLDRAARNEAPDNDATGTIPDSADTPRGGPVTLASAEAPRHEPQVLNDWVVRDVYRGIALVEGPQGAVEVMPGDVLPGAGTVRAIERRGDGWIVLTSRGYVDSDHD